MRKIITTVATATALALSLSGCALLGIKAEPYGGQCNLIGEPVMAATTAMTGLGSANFSLQGDKLQKFVWDRGYKNIAEWNTDVSKVADFIGLVDTSKVSTEEAATLKTIKSSFANNGILMAEVAGKESWFTETYDALIAVGSACDGKW